MKIRKFIDTMSLSSMERILGIPSFFLGYIYIKVAYSSSKYIFNATIFQRIAVQ
jgi:hypothetical protein